MPSLRKCPRAITSAPTRSKAPITSPLAPPGNFIILASGPRFENFQIKIARMNCAARKADPGLGHRLRHLRIDQCACVEISSGASQVCSRIGIAERIAMMMIVIAKNLAMMIASTGFNRLDELVLRNDCFPFPPDDKAQL